MALEDDLKQWIAETTGKACYYQHANSPEESEYVWFIRAGDDSEDELDATPGEEPDRVFFDVEIYAATSAACSAIAKTLRAKRDYRGLLEPSDGYADDIGIEDTQDDYEPQAEAQDLPPFMSALRLTLSGYTPGT